MMLHLILHLVQREVYIANILDLPQLLAKTQGAKVKRNSIFFSRH
jgi:hypothetical protein